MNVFFHPGQLFRTAFRWAVLLLVLFVFCASELGAQHVSSKNENDALLSSNRFTSFGQLRGQLMAHGLYTAPTLGLQWKQDRMRAGVYPMIPLMELPYARTRPFIGGAGLMYTYLLAPDAQAYRWTLEGDYAFTRYKLEANPVAVELSGPTKALNIHNLLLGFGFERAVWQESMVGLLIQCQMSVREYVQRDNARVSLLDVQPSFGIRFGTEF